VRLQGKNPDMKQRKLGGRSRLMRPALEYARQNGFDCTFTEANHLAFHGHGGRVIAAGTPRSGQAALTAIARMRALVRQASHAMPSHQALSGPSHGAIAPDKRAGNA
jgi:hypothetical protein